MTEVAVADAHAVLWYAQGRPKKLGRNARRVFERAEEGRAVVYLPALAVVEVGEAMRNGKLKMFPGGLSAWVRHITGTGRFVALDLTIDIVLHAETLCDIPERGDRLIAATASRLGVPLLSRDPEIAAAAGVDVIW